MGNLLVCTAVIPLLKANTSYCTFPVVKGSPPTTPSPMVSSSSSQEAINANSAPNEAERVRILKNLIQSILKPRFYRNWCTPPLPLEVGHRAIRVWKVRKYICQDPPAPLPRLK